MSYLRHSKACVFWLIPFLLLPILAVAQEVSFVGLISEAEFSIAPGEQKEISLSFLVREGYHIQACEVGDENLIPTVLSIDAPEDLNFGDPVFPETVEFRMKGVEEAWQVYSDVVEINIPLKAEESFKTGTHLVKGNLHYQACDDSKCYFPRDLPFEMKIIVE